MTVITMFKAKNGKIFDNIEDCAKEDNLAVCYACKGKGVEKYEHRIPYPSGLPDSGWVDDTIEIRTRECSRCKGLKYVEYNKEEDPEYIEYQRLKQKFN